MNTKHRYSFCKYCETISVCHWNILWFFIFHSFFEKMSFGADGNQRRVVQNEMCNLFDSETSPCVAFWTYARMRYASCSLIICIFHCGHRTNEWTIWLRAADIFLSDEKLQTHWLENKIQSGLLLMWERFLRWTTFAAYLQLQIDQHWETYTSVDYTKIVRFMFFIAIVFYKLSVASSLNK